MSVVTVKGLAISNRDSTPPIISNNALVRGDTQSTRGQAVVTNGDSIASLYLLGQIPSNARIVEALLYCDAITSAAGDIGLYDTTANGGAAVSGQFFAAAQSLAAALSGSNITRSAVNTVAKMEQYVWQVLGLASDPNKWYDVGVKLTAAATATGNVALDIKYV